MRLPLQLDPTEPRLPADHRHAAVAVVLREVASVGPEVLLMQRAEREGDRWSGQISLPGGHREEADVDLAATAAREAWEELGVAIEAPALGHLSPIQGRARGGLLPLTIAPVVFAWPARGRIALGDEAQDAFWFPLRDAAGGGFDADYPYEHEGVRHLLPSWRFVGRPIWGLTYRILSDLLRRGAFDARDDSTL